MQKYATRGYRDIKHYLRWRTVPDDAKPVQETTAQSRVSVAKYNDVTDRPAPSSCRAEQTPPPAVLYM